MVKNAFLMSFILCLIVLIAGCGNSQQQVSGPEGAIFATYQALENQDTVSFLQSLAEEKRNTFESDPSRLTKLMSDWKGQHATVKILTVKQNDSTAKVLYNLTVTGPKPYSQDSVVADMYMQEGMWRHGY